MIIYANEGKKWGHKGSFIKIISYLLSICYIKNVQIFNTFFLILFDLKKFLCYITTA